MRIHTGDILRCIYRYFIKLYGKLMDYTSQECISASTEQSCMFEADAMELWPTGILRRHTPKPLAVLITTGSFNPIHSGHIQCMEDARKAVEDKGYKVVAGYISPSSDGYVKGKMRRLATSANVPLEMVYADVSYRIHLTRLACADSGWLSCSSWEASQPGFVDFDDVTYALDMFLRNNSFFRSVRDTVFYVCGSDHYNKCGLSRGIYNRQDQKYRHVAVCVRLGDNDDADTITPPQSSVVTIVHSNSSLNEGVSASSIVTGGESDTLCDVNSTKVCATASLSSTKVRALLNSAPVGGQLPCGS